MSQRKVFESHDPVLKQAHMQDISINSRQHEAEQSTRVQQCKRARAQEQPASIYSSYMGCYLKLTFLTHSITSVFVFLHS